jgi:hypothetical protein
MATTAGMQTLTAVQPKHLPNSSLQVPYVVHFAGHFELVASSCDCAVCAGICQSICKFQCKPCSANHYLLLLCSTGVPEVQLQQQGRHVSSWLLLSHSTCSSLCSTHAIRFLGEHAALVGQRQEALLQQSKSTQYNVCDPTSVPISRLVQIAHQVGVTNGPSKRYH